MTKLSRSKIELFTDCPRCFWLEMNRKIKRPPPAPYTINSAIDYLLKEEFDLLRAKGIPHPIMKENGVDAIPYQCQELDQWRHNFTGIQFHHEPTDFLVFGAVDDIWINPNKELIVVDYKATGAKEHKIYDSYTRQMEVYQWLLLKNGYKVSKKGYFLFARVDKGSGFKGEKLPFKLFLEGLEGDTSWIENAILSARKTIDGEIPPLNEECEYCQFVRSQNENLSQSPAQSPKEKLPIQTELF